MQPVLVLNNNPGKPYCGVRGMDSPSTEPLDDAVTAQLYAELCFWSNEIEKDAWETFLLEEDETPDEDDSVIDPYETLETSHLPFALPSEKRSFDSWQEALKWLDGWSSTRGYGMRKKGAGRKNNAGNFTSYYVTLDALRSQYA
ncbi:hypothetical protein PV08_08991 [Exophiala spinifera]|uniref:Uncharacterized protein n=1 Tax=Exophiala spinifera TaxID=91928 RepID=A0A0D2BRB3_9EURO|nr:uncharacterized protein PV08_08991 [Exophiala spinifera]KIW13799.1 hypothetical protein PV08_08991 [Exophiala spinifera]